MLRHEIKIAGPAVGRDRISGPLLADLLRVMVDGAQGVLRFRLEGRSRAKGSRPAWLRSAADFQFLPSRDSRTIHLEAKALKDVLPEKFRQRDFFETVDPNKSALDLFEDGLEDALRGNADSDLFDDGLASTFSEIRNLYDQGLKSLEIINGRRVPVSLEGLAQVETLRRQTPSPRSVRVAGKLDAIRYSDRMFELVLQTGEKLRGVAEEVDEAKLKTLWGKQVVVVGVAVFRPSGTLLRIEARTVVAASDDDLHVWSATPQPLSVPLDTRVLHVPQGPRSGLHAILGRWPGDETDDAVSYALKDLS